MKKYLALGLTFLMAMSIFAGCGKSDETTTNKAGGNDAGDIYDYSNVNELVTLGQYEGLNIEMDIPSEVTDATIRYYIEGMLETVAFLEDESKDTVEADSIVCLNYKGIKDGVPFEGGAAENQIIDVAGNRSTAGSTYIDGFTAGLPGAKVGDTVSYDVKFPDAYDNEELAGQTVVFEFTINYICKTISYDELTDENVSQLFSAESVDDLKKQIKTMLESTVESDYEDAVREKIQAAIEETSTINIPDEMINARIDYLCKSYEEYFGASFEEISQVYMGTSAEEYKVKLASQARTSITAELLFRAIAEDAGIKYDEAEHKAYIAKLVANYATNGVNNEEDLYQMIKPSEKESGEEFVKNMYLCNKAMDYCMEKANIVKMESKSN